MKIEVLDEQLDEIVLESLKHTLDIMRADSSEHPDDVAYKDRLIPALEIVIDSFGG